MPGSGAEYKEDGPGPEGGEQGQTELGALGAFVEAGLHNVDARLKPASGHASPDAGHAAGRRLARPGRRRRGRSAGRADGYCQGARRADRGRRGARRATEWYGSAGGGWATEPRAKNGRKSTFGTVAEPRRPASTG